MLKTLGSYVSAFSTFLVRQQWIFDLYNTWQDKESENIRLTSWMVFTLFMGYVGTTTQPSSVAKHQLLLARFLSVHDLSRSLRTHGLICWHDTPRPPEKAAIRSFSGVVSQMFAGWVQWKRLRGLEGSKGDGEVWVEGAWYGKVAKQSLNESI